jgi:SAM-dependent methyltransferase
MKKDNMKASLRNPMECIVCNSQEFTALPTPSNISSMLTDGTILEASYFNKLECNKCGFVFSKDPNALLKAHNYMDDYDLHNRPTSLAYEEKRVESYARVLKDHITNKSDFSFLEIGCGYGGFLQAIKKFIKLDRYIGLEPSKIAASKIGSEITIINSLFPTDKLQEKFDLIYHMHVFEHVLNPDEFVEEIKNSLNEDGEAVFVVPASEQVFNEILFVDHIWSWTKENVVNFLEKHGLEVTKSFHTFSETSGEHVNWIFAKKPKFPIKKSAIKHLDPKISDQRKEYLRKWSLLNQNLTARLPLSGEVAVFGASEWALLLRTFSPTVWSRISLVTVDGCQDSEYLGKKLIPFEKFLTNKEVSFILAVKPHSVSGLTKRFSDLGLKKPIEWHDLIS